MGTSFCRLCGRDYVEEPNTLLASLGPPTEDVVPEQAPSIEPPVLMPVAAAAPVASPVVDAPVTWPPPSAPLVAGPAGPPVQAAPFELVPVPATGGLQVHLPLAELTDLVPAPSSEPVLAPVAEAQPGKPAPTDTHALELGGPVLTAPEEEPVAEEATTARVLDRTAVVAGALAGFVGGVVSGAAVTLFLT